MTTAVCSIADNYTQELSKKPDKRCWGCGKVEVKGEPKFRNCPKCISLKLLPCVFCSDECFRDNWSRHKLFHKAVKKAKDKSVGKTLNEAMLKDLEQIEATQELDFNNFRMALFEGQKYMAQFEYAKARKVLRKAQKMDPACPFAYISLGSTYIFSDQLVEAMNLYEAGIERFAACCLTGKRLYKDLMAFGSKSIMRSAHEEGFATAVETFLSAVTKRKTGDYKMPAWICNDGIFKRILGVCKCGTTGSGILRQLNVWHAFALVGVFHNGIYQSRVGAADDRTAKDLEEAAECFLTAAKIQEETGYKMTEYDMPEKDPVWLRKMADQAATQAKEKRPSNSPFYRGCFVLVYGLTSVVGKSLNKKLGIVKTYVNQDERMGVQIDGIAEPKSLKPTNMMVLPLPDRDIALVSCMSLEAQWNYLRPIAQEYAARLPDPA